MGWNFNAKAMKKTRCRSISYQKPGIARSIFHLLEKQECVNAELKFHERRLLLHYGSGLVLKRYFTWKGLIGVPGYEGRQGIFRPFAGRIIHYSANLILHADFIHYIFSELSFMAGLEGFSGGSVCWWPRMSLQDLVKVGQVWKTFAFLLLSFFALLPSLVK